MTRRIQPWPVAIAAVVLAAVLGGMLLARQEPAHAMGARPEIRMSVDDASWPTSGQQGTAPTALAYYADGTRGDASAALTRPWTPDRPVVMLVLVAVQTCTVQVGDVMILEGAGVNRAAVCVWRAASA